MANDNQEVKRGRGRPEGSGKLYQFRGRKQTLQAWAEELGIPYMTLYQRKRKGLETRDAFVRPLHARKTPRALLRPTGASQSQQASA